MEVIKIEKITKLLEKVKTENMDLYDCIAILVMDLYEAEREALAKSGKDQAEDLVMTINELQAMAAKTFEVAQHKAKPNAVQKIIKEKQARIDGLNASIEDLKEDKEFLEMKQDQHEESISFLRKNVTKLLKQAHRDDKLIEELREELESMERKLLAAKAKK